LVEQGSFARRTVTRFADLRPIREAPGNRRSEGSQAGAAIVEEKSAEHRRAPYLVPPTQELIGDALELSVPHAVSAEPSVRRGLIRLNPCGVGRERDIDGFLDEI
jgi:hypothetical protein